MHLPDYVISCVNRLEQAGFAAYAVGGCVRDSLLGLVPSDYDLCTAALPEQTQALFADFPLVLAGKKHGTVGVITSGGLVEITTFRTEGDYGDNRHPSWVEFVPHIEADLARRDFTVNAMAYSPTRGFADPFGGREDLRKKVLRAVGAPDARFREDSLRILRGVRFAARYDFTAEKATRRAMSDQRQLMENLARERVFDELCKLLLTANAQHLLEFSDILAGVIPQLQPMIGFNQRSPHHTYDLFTHTAQVTAAVPGELTLRWAALLHDTGKIPTFTLDPEGRGHFYGHARESAAIADRVLRELRAPTRLREDTVQLIELHMNRLEPDKKLLRRWLSRLGSETLNRLLTLQEADMGSKGTGIRREAPSMGQIRALLRELEAEKACLSRKDLAVGGHDLLQLGYRGREVGRCLEALLSRVLEEQLPNEKAALLRWAAGEISEEPGRNIP